MTPSWCVELDSVCVFLSVHLDFNFNPITFCFLYICVTGCTGMLGELVGSHTKVAIYPTYIICCKRL